MPELPSTPQPCACSARFPARRSSNLNPSSGISWFPHHTQLLAESRGSPRFFGSRR